MKKFLKISAIIIGLLIVALIAAPFVFEAKLKDLVKQTINNNVDATVEFRDLDLTLFRSFPQATLVLQDVSIINKAPFAGDTLAISEEVLLEMSIKELFKGGEDPKRVDELKLKNAFVNIKIDSLGNNNYDIAIKDESEKSSTSNPFQLDLKHYEIENSRFSYSDFGNKTYLKLEQLNHEGTGDFSLKRSELTTTSSALISLDYDGLNYLNKNKLALDALIDMDLENLKYTFKENKATINQLPLTFKGYVDVNDDNNEIDLSFKTPSSSFKNFLAVIPETYVKNIEKVQTSGDFIVDGRIQGVIDDTYIPKMDIKIASNNASFKYPDLPKAVKDINMNINLLNESGLIDDTFLDIQNFSFRIDQDTFTGKGSLKNLTGNMLVDMMLKGTIDLANLEQAYPLQLEQDLNGVLTADVTTLFDMNSIEKKQYNKVNSKGTARLDNFSYRSPEIQNQIKIANAIFIFNQGNVKVPDLYLTTGKTDIQAAGNIENLMGFLFTDQQLKGNFQVNSKTFSVNDFVMAETKVAESEGEKDKTSKTVIKAKEAVKIPSFLNTELTFSANKVLYDNLTLNNVKGKMIIKDETATLQNVTSNIFDGTIALNGNVSTKGEVPTFKMDLGLNALDIAQSFNGLELLQGLAPIASALQGKLQTQINLTGNLNDDLSLKLNSIAGDALAQLLTAEVIPEKLALFSKLDSQLKFLNLDKLNLDNLKGKITFNDGSVQVAPFDFKVKGININIAGNHSFDNIMNYNVTMDVPAKMLGSEIGGTLSKLSAQELDKMIVALPIGLSGSFQNPDIKLNMQQAVNNITQQIISTQKQELKQKGIDALGNIISGGNKQAKTNDTTATIPTNTTIPQTKKDSVRATQQKQVKEAAGEVLKGLLGGKKKTQDTTKVN